MLPEIPVITEPAPRPAEVDQLDQDSLTARAWVRGWSGRHYAVYLVGPAAFSDEAGVCVYFPTFGKHAQQSALLRAAGYVWTGRLWIKRVPGDQTVEELRWARRLYSTLHPNWRRDA